MEEDKKKFSCKKQLKLYYKTREEKYLHSIFVHCHKALMLQAERALNNTDFAKAVVSETYMKWRELIIRNEDTNIDSCCKLATYVLGLQIKEWRAKEKRHKTKEQKKEQYFDVSILETEDY